MMKTNNYYSGNDEVMHHDDYNIAEKSHGSKIDKIREVLRNMILMLPEQEQINIDEMSEQELLKYAGDIFVKKEQLKKQHLLKVQQTMKILELPYYINEEDSVKITDLYDIFMDDQKLQNLISKLKNKSFW